MRKSIKLKYILGALFLSFIFIGCSKTEQTSTKAYSSTGEDVSYALPQIGEAAIINAEMQAGTKGTITVATVGSPNVEILQEAARILGEKGWMLKIEMCQDYMMGNQLVTEGKVDCNYYQHKAFLERYNIEKETELVEYAKIHYEPMVIFSEKVKNTKEISKSAKVLVPENPTAMAQALFLLQQEGLLSLMSDADLTAVEDDILENPLELEFVVCAEEEMMEKLGQYELAICHKSYAIKAGKEAEKILLAEESRDSLAAQNLAQGIVINGSNIKNTEMLVEVLMSAPMQQFVQNRYLNTIYMLDGKNADIAELAAEEVTPDLTKESAENE